MGLSSASLLLLHCLNFGSKGSTQTKDPFTLPLILTNVHGQDSFTTACDRLRHYSAKCAKKNKKKPNNFGKTMTPAYMSPECLKYARLERCDRAN